MGPATSEQEQGQGQGHGQKQEQQRGLHQDQDHEHGQEGKPNKRQTSVSFASTPPSVSSGDSGGGEWRKARGSAASARQWRQQLEDEAGQLTVCDITGDWGLYQWSLCLFAIIFSAVSALPVVFGPILTPDMPFRCNETNSNFDHQTGQPLGNATGGAADQNECFKSTTLPDGRLLSEPCRSFLYDDTKLGLTLTNRVSARPNPLLTSHLPPPTSCASCASCASQARPEVGRARAKGRAEKWPPFCRARFCVDLWPECLAARAPFARRHRARPARPSSLAGRLIQ